MVAIDTNILVRFLAGDDAAQSLRARQLLETEAIWVATTVLLESEWVLRRLLKVPRPVVMRLLHGFAGLPNVTLQDTALVALAFDLEASARQGVIELSVGRFLCGVDFLERAAMRGLEIRGMCLLMALGTDR